MFVHAISFIAIAVALGFVSLFLLGVAPAMIAHQEFGWEGFLPWNNPWLLILQAIPISIVAYTICIGAIFGVLYFLVWLWDLVTLLGSSAQKGMEETFLSASYRSWKEKYCTRVVLKK